MKREGKDHPKFKLVARDLKLPLCFVRGIIESIWLETSVNWHRGDIGNWSNDEIAIAIDYPGDADELVAVLLKRHLLDEIPSPGRLYVHDWHEHSDRHVNLRILRSHSKYANGVEGRRAQAAGAQTEQNEDTGAQNTQNSDIHSQKRDMRTPPEPEPEPEPEPKDKQTSISQEPEQAAAPPPPNRVRSSSRSPIEIPRKSMPSARSPGNQTLDANKLRWMRSCLHDYMSVDPSGIGPPRTDLAYPRDEVVLKCLEIVAGVDDLAVVAFLNERLKAGQRRGRPGGPKDYPWFITVLGTHFQPAALVTSRAGGAHA